MPWWDFVRQSVWEPLHIVPAVLTGESAPASGDVAGDHVFDSDTLQPTSAPVPAVYPHLDAAGAQAIHMPTAALARLATEVRNAARGAASVLGITRALARDALTPHTPIPGHPFMQGVGLGFTRFHNGTWGHIGNARGQHSAVFVHPTHQITLAMQTNVYSSLPFFWEVSALFFSELEAPVEAPVKKRPSYAGIYRCAALAVEVHCKDDRWWLRVLEPVGEGVNEVPGERYELERLPGPEGMFAVRGGGRVVRGPVFFSWAAEQICLLRINLLTLHRFSA
jgi:CubicO group peptidase (beta-lactamase class C family)